MKKSILSGLAVLGLSSAQASIPSCPSANFFYASGFAESAGFSLQTRSGHFLQSSYLYLDGDLNVEFFFLDFHQELLPPFDSYSHDLSGMIADYGVGYYPGSPLEIDYGDSISGIERFGLNGVVTDWYTHFSMDLHFVYDGENWTGSGRWEYYSLPFDDLIACQNPIPEATVPESAPGTAAIAGLFGLALLAKKRIRRR